jgi:hypothetical protein
LNEKLLLNSELPFIESISIYPTATKGIFKLKLKIKKQAIQMFAIQGDSLEIVAKVFKKYESMID